MDTELGPWKGIYGSIVFTDEEIQYGELCVMMGFWPFRATVTCIEDEFRQTVERYLTERLTA